jgi:hypothetical protein
LDHIEDGGRCENPGLGFQGYWGNAKLDRCIALYYICGIQYPRNEVLMPDNTPSKPIQEVSSKQFNARLPQLTHSQIKSLSNLYGLTKTQVIIVAVDRLARDLKAESPGVEKDVRRLKTVARIAPEIDLGQDE